MFFSKILRLINISINFTLNKLSLPLINGLLFISRMKEGVHIKLKKYDFNYRL